MATPANRKAFTLIELLVVISIIVVLLALLVPALQKAIYRAELAKCAAQLDTIATNVILYANAHKEYYPYRPSQNLNVGGDEGAPVYLVSAGLMGLVQYTSGKRNDDRPIIASFMPVNTLIDPFCPEFDLTREDTQQGTDDVFASYDMLWGWGYDGEGVMQKLGSAVTWQNPQTKKFYKWKVLAMDRDSAGDTYPPTAVASSHPDNDGLLAEDFRDPDSDSSTGFDLWVSQWSSQTAQRGTIDKNIAFDDGSVQPIPEAIGGTALQGTVTVPKDPRLALAPLNASGTGHTTKYVLMPNN